MCTAVKYCSDFVNSVSIALQSYVTEHRILSSLPFIQRQSNEVQMVLLFFGTFFIFVAVHWWCFFCFVFKEVELISFERRKLHWGMCLIRICLSVKREITANLPLWILKKIKNKHVKCLVRPEQKRTWQNIYIRKVWLSEKLRFAKCILLFFDCFCFLSFHIYCAILYIMCKYNTLSVGLAEEMGGGVSWGQ